MVEIAIAGREEFLLGFKLAGVRYTYNTEEDSRAKIEEAMNNSEVGVLVVDNPTMESLPERFKEKITDSVSPVVLELSGESDNSRLREKITRAIGVDLWEKGDDHEG